MFGIFRKKQSGRSPSAAAWLTTNRFPSYLYLGKNYEVLTKENLGSTFPVGDPMILYLIRGKEPDDEVFFIRCQFDLPKVFWVRQIIGFHSEFEFLPEENDGDPWQVRQARMA